jgi:hypothetical protein
LRKADGGVYRTIAKDFFRAGTEIAVMSKDRGKVRGILLGDAGHRAQENRETDREDALFTAREDAAAKIKGAQSRFLDRCSAEVISDQSYLFSFLRSGGYRFTQLSKAEHGGRPVSHGGVGDQFRSGRLRLPERGDSHRMAALETIQ